MRVLHIISSIDRKAGGPSRSSQGLVAAQEAAGIEAWLMTCVPGERPWLNGVKHFFEGIDPVEAIEKVDPDLVHIHCIWDLRLHWAASACRRWGIPYVIAPRGMLEPWSLRQKKWKKRLAMWLYQRGDLMHAVALHATASSEGAQFRKLGFIQSIIESPNGIIVPEVLPPRDVHYSDPDGKHRVLFVSRMHPKKGVMELVDAWSQVRPEGWLCELVYTVNGETEREYEQKVKAYVMERGLVNAFVFTGPLMDDAKWAAYRRADLFILPTYSENFGIVIPEALYAGVPVITTRGTPWGELVEHKCGWWIDLPPHATLVAALREAIACPPAKLAEMGSRGRSLVEEKYLWPALGRKMKSQYEALDVFVK